MTGKRIVAAMAALAMAFGLAGCGKEVAETKESVRPVRVRPVVQAPDYLQRGFSGITRAGAVVRLSFRTGGEVEKVAVSVGDKVKQGQLIATLDSRDARLNLEKALASLEKSRVQSENAHTNLKRLRNLYEANNVPVSELEKARDTYANARATFDADTRSVRLLKREMTYTTLVSPMDGIVASRSVEPNENVASGSVVAVVQAGDTIEVETGIPELWISKVRQGQGVSVSFPSIAEKTFFATVTEVAFESDSETHTYPVTLAMEATGTDIRPGMPATVVFRFKRETQGALMVPVHAVAEDTQGNFVYVVVEKEGAFYVERRAVTVGQMLQEGFQVTSGLVAGEKVVTAGLPFLADGKKVTLIAGGERQ